MHQILAEFAPMLEELKNLPQLRDVKKDLLEASEFAFLKSMLSKDKLDKAPINHLAYAFEKVQIARRLESGLSTSNVSQQVQHLKK